MLNLGLGLRRVRLSRVRLALAIVGKQRILNALPWFDIIIESFHVFGQFDGNLMWWYPQILLLISKSPLDPKDSFLSRVGI